MSKATQARNETIARLYNKGIPLDEIAATVGCTVHTVKWRIGALRDSGQVGNRRRDRAAALRDEIERLYNSGLERSEIAARLGTKPSYVGETLAALRHAGRIAPGRRGRPAAGSGVEADTLPESPRPDPREEAYRRQEELERRFMGAPRGPVKTPFGRTPRRLALPGTHVPTRVEGAW